jgi:hypothetical protein
MPGYGGTKPTSNAADGIFDDAPLLAVRGSVTTGLFAAMSIVVRR